MAQSMQAARKPQDVSLFEGNYAFTRNSLIESRYRLYGGVSYSIARHMGAKIRQFERNGGSICVVPAKETRFLNGKVKGRNKGCDYIRVALDAWTGMVIVAYNAQGEIVGALDYIEKVSRVTGKKAIIVGNLGSNGEIPGTGMAIQVTLANIAAEKGLFVESQYDPRAKNFHAKIGRWMPRTRGHMPSVWSSQDCAQIAKATPLTFKDKEKLPRREQRIMEEVLA